MAKLLMHKRNYTSIERKFNCKLSPSQQTTDKQKLKEKCTPSFPLDDLIIEWQNQLRGR
ncbi:MULTISPECIES: hypothetical protein [Pasteurellaceae]|uniref:Uncharacterized protein n=1 Tax=Pasteurella atlantica TaxID=2827233 RepID=A0AAW8CME6_9PAST|nr:hypothetical protein [Pasteurella atlantica]MBR0574468.1 hypothetical protein [Pasteurella atlantica]MDP8039345.1 hypothetical protein [Pasteurella atlantica]MDP8041437.1 hypothetical protein [Pasteurella atlantica]MDP8043638.1 hypothetical protein [Pasteurella atlantica]MDP8045658.1 hypothetical protein [Pasteurella atlantica]